MKKIIMPGEQISKKPFLNETTVVENGATYAAVIGFMDEENRFVPAKSAYKPNVGDNMVGVVVYVRGNGYKIDLNLSSEAFLSGKDTAVPFTLGDILFGKIKSVDEIGNVDLAEVRKLPPGKIIEFPPAKIPRLIGKRNSMLITIMNATRTDIYVGNNGYVYLSGGNIPLALHAIDLVKKKAHTNGLTQQVADFLAQKQIQSSKEPYDQNRTLAYKPTT